MISPDHQVGVPPWDFIPPPPPPGPPPPRQQTLNAIPPPPPPPPRSPRKQHLKAAPSLEDTVASTFTSGNSSGGTSMSHNLAEEIRRATRSMHVNTTDPVEMARLENATVTSDDFRSQSQFSDDDEDDDQVWDPILMDRLSPTTEESMSEFSEARWQQPEVKSPNRAQTTSQFRSIISPVSSPREKVRSFAVQQASIFTTSSVQSPVLQRSPLSEKQEATDMAMSREKLRAQHSLVQSFSVETPQSMHEMSHSVSTDGSSVENKADGPEEPTRFSETTLSSLAEVEPKDSESVMAVSPRRPLLRHSDVKEGEKSKTDQVQDQTQSGNTPDKKKHRHFLSKFMGVRGGKDGHAKESKNSPSAVSARQVNGKLVTANETSLKIRKVKKVKKNRRGKANLVQKIGAPLDLKPGMSYRSTPNSAEIVVRRSVAEAHLSEEEEEEEEDQSEESVSVDPPVSSESESDPRRAELTVSTNSGDLDELDIMESFSPPEFDNIEAISKSTSLSPDSHNITLSSDQDRRFRHCNEAFSNEEMSAITDPTFGQSIDRRTREVIEATSPVKHTENTAHADPLGHYWGTGRSPSAHSLQRRNVADPFSTPFFEDHTSDATSPLDSGSSFINEAVDESIKGRHQIGEPLHRNDEIGSSISDECEDGPAMDSTRMTPRNKIAGRRSELMERRKAIAEKAKGQPATENVREDREARLGRKSETITERAKRQLATENIREAREARLDRKAETITEKGKSQLATENVREAREARPNRKAEASLPVRHREHIPSNVYEQSASPQRARIPSETTSRLPSSSPYGDRAAFSALSAIPSRSQSAQANQTPAPPSASTSLLVKLQGRKLQAISSSSRVNEVQRGGLMEARVISSTSRMAVTMPPDTIKKSTRTPVLEITPQRVDLESISLGLAIKRRSRELLILQGKDVVVRPQRKKIATPRQYKPSNIDLDESRIKDPIKRAGIRLLAKAAVPIQCEIRRFLAQQAAVDRLWAIIELQSYFRRWKGEAFLLAHKHSATKIQSTFRGWQARDILLTEHYCATQIQKIVRAFHVSVQTYDRLYRIIMAQAAARGFLARMRFQRARAILLAQATVRGFLARMRFQRARAILLAQATVRGFIVRKRYHRVRERVILIQRCYRGCQARLEVAIWHVGATIIQSAGRAYLAQLRYQFDLVDIIIVQSVARRWLAIQGAHREMSRELEVEEHEAASKIQAAWRGFKATTDFIFALADIIILQRSARQWLAVKELKSLKENMRAVKIQSLWRGYKARMTMLYSLVDVIIVQSVVRRHLAYKRVRERQEELEWLPVMEAAAVKIQSSWRGFWHFSHYLILQFELVKLQAAVRGHLVRSDARLRLGCIIILQATMRKFLVRKALQGTRAENCLLASSAFGLRETIASKRIQSFWRDIFRSKKEKSEREKAAALTIERFFMMVKAAVDLEVLRHEHHRKYDSFGGHDSNLRGQQDLLVSTNISVLPAAAVDVPTHEDDVSEMTSPSVFYRRQSIRPPSGQYTPRDEFDETCLEETWDEKEIHEARKQRLMEDDYLQRYGLSERESRRRQKRPSSRESPRRHHVSSGTPRERRSPHVESEFVSPRDRRTPSSRDRQNMLPTARHSNNGRFWSEEDRYRKEVRRAPSARTYRSPKHYEETDTMRSEFSPHSSRARHSHSSGNGRHRSTRGESPRVHDDYVYELDDDEGKHQRARSRHRRRGNYDETPRRRISSREGEYQRRIV